MKKNFNVISILLVLTLCFSCRTYLTPAVLGTNINYVPKPMAADSAKSKIYVSGTLGGATSPNASVDFSFGMLEVNRSHTYKNLNFSYGGYGYLGKARYVTTIAPAVADSPPPLSDFEKNTSGMGVRTSIGYHETSQSKNVDFRLISWENSFAWEMGDYADFRRDLYNSPIIYSGANVSNKTFIWTTGIATEVIFRSPRTHNFKNAFRVFMGGSNGVANSYKDSAPRGAFTTRTSYAFSFSYYLQYKAFSFTYQLATNNNASNTGSLGFSF